MDTGKNKYGQHPDPHVIQEDEAITQLVDCFARRRRVRPMGVNAISDTFRRAGEYLERRFNDGKLIGEEKNEHTDNWR